MVAAILAQNTSYAIPLDPPFGRRAPWARFCEDTITCRGGRRGEGSRRQRHGVQGMPHHRCRQSRWVGHKDRFRLFTSRVTHSPRTLEIPYRES